MKISRIKLQNFKSFRDSPWIGLSPSRTVVVGQNNSGKTALLQALRFGDNVNAPHRGPQAVPPSAGSRSLFHADIIIDGRTLEDALKVSARQVYVPLPTLGDNAAFLQSIWANAALVIKVKSSPGTQLLPAESPSHGMRFDGHDGTGNLVQFVREQDQFQIYDQRSDDTLPTIIDGLRHRHVYVFDPERLKIGSCAAQETTHLDSSARNLPAVLATMSRNPATWKVFNRHVNEVFPSVKAVTVSTVGSEIAVYVWQNDPEMAPDDYAVLLQDSGTGLAQVISILYVAMTRTDNVIAIDEPNSFLHPGAAKKLMNILKYYDKNQYIISTHSPELIKVFDPDLLLAVTWREGESHVERLDRHSIDDLEAILSDLGCELSDLFAADRVVWCEGMTETKVFSLIARASGLNITTTAFLELRATGDLESRKIGAKAILDIYARLSAGPSLLPRSTVFNLDREERSQVEIDDLVRQSRGRIKFLPARTVENFLIDADAIAAVLAADYASTKSDAAPPTATDVQQWLNRHATQYGDVTGCARMPSGDINAPKLLSAMYPALTDNLHTYRKLHHSIELARWLLANKPRSLDRLADYVRDLVEDDRPI